MNSIRARQKILIVSPDPSVHEELRSWLVDPLTEGALPQARLESAFDGTSALTWIERAASQGEAYALILLEASAEQAGGLAAIWRMIQGSETLLCILRCDSAADGLLEGFTPSERLSFLKRPFEPARVRELARAAAMRWNRSRRAASPVFPSEAESAQRQLDEARERLLHTSKMSELGQVAVGVAHEINNPLAAIGALNEQLREMLQDGERPEDLIELTHKIDVGVARIAKIVGGLKGYARNEGQDPTQVVSLKEIFSELVEWRTEKHQARRTRVHIAHLPETMLIDCRPTQIAQVLLNMLNNAFDAVDALEDRWVRVEASQDEDKEGRWIRIRVSDSGPGIPDELRRRIFQPFFTTKEAGRGTGLGLSISKGIIESHRGKLEIDDTVKNTCFIISLPLAESRAAAGADSLAPAGADSHAPAGADSHAPAGARVPDVESGLA